MSLFSRAFLRYASERAIKTLAQTIAALLVASETPLVDVSGWLAVLATAGIAALVSVCTSVQTWVDTGGHPPALRDAPPVGADGLLKS